MKATAAPEKTSAAGRSNSKKTAILDLLRRKDGATIAEIAKVAHLRMDGLPQGVDPLLDATATYEPAISTGVYSYATHGAVVAVDPETGFIELLDYAVAEDCGTMVNPMLVEGQIRGGVVQGIGTALYEEIPYDETGQPLAGKIGRAPCRERV